MARPRKDFANKWIHLLRVRTRGAFPLDMLRYDCASPYREVDSHAIAKSLEDDADCDVIVLRRCESKDHGRAWSFRRWSSYGCMVEPIEDMDAYQHMPTVGW